MTDIPILFAGPMVRALMEGRKTQTRRVLKLHPSADGGRFVVTSPKEEIIELESGEFGRGACHYLSTGGLSGPYKIGYAIGDRLWVRESFADIRGMGFGTDPRTGKPFQFAFAADTKPGSDGDRARLEYGVKWKPSIHMPRALSRLTLLVTDVRVERVQDISEEDAKAEGAERMVMDDDGKFYPDPNGTYRCGFAGLWEHLNAKRGYGWAVNPWVVAVTFTVHKSNIDALPHPVEKGE